MKEKGERRGEMEEEEKGFSGPMPNSFLRACKAHKIVCLVNVPNFR